MRYRVIKFAERKYMAVARNWRAIANEYWVSVWEHDKTWGTQWWWLYNNENVAGANELYILKGECALPICYYSKAMLSDTHVTFAFSMVTLLSASPTFKVFGEPNKLPCSQPKLSSSAWIQALTTSKSSVFPTSTLYVIVGSFKKKKKTINQVKTLVILFSGENKD